MKYPFYAYCYKFDLIRIKKLITNFSPLILNVFPKEFEKYPDKYFIIVDKWENTAEINDLTNMFSEEVRITCKFGNEPTPLEYWEKNKDAVIQKTKKDYGEPVAIFNIRETIFAATKLCNNFRITVALAVLQHFKVKKWLDISSGWGDRLLAAIFHNVELYVGADPNKDLHPCYQKMINTFVPPNKRERFKVFESGFEDAPIPNTMFDLVFTSPPFFDLEKYSTYKGDSITKFKGEKNWTDNFLMVSILKAYKYLEPGGHMILYLHDEPYLNKRLKELDPIMTYKGKIYFCEAKCRGMHVWQKNK
jgi:hypothetical protein